MSRTRTAFWACRRLAACLYTAEAAESMSIRGYTTYEYTQTVARAIEDLVRKSKA